MSFTREELHTRTIGVLLGGLSEEREVSQRTGAAVVGALKSLGYEVLAIDAGTEVAAELRAKNIHVVFNALHGRWGEDGCIQGLLEYLRIPYAGSGVLASAAGMDKVFSKRLFMSQGIDTPDYALLPAGKPASTSMLPFGLPCVVKPSGEGSSVGVSIVHAESELGPASELARRYKGDVIVERYVKGRELACAVLGDRALGCIEIRPAGEFYDYDAKYNSKTTQYLYPAPLEENVYQAVLDLSLRAHKALGCDGATRADLIVDAGGRPWMLEVNTLPGMTATSLIPKIAAGAGIDFPQLCEALVMGASLKA